MLRDQVTTAAVLLTLSLSPVALAEDWPSWRGPNLNGITTAKDFDPAFAKGGADVQWTQDIGVGFSGVTVADGLTYTAGWKDGKTTFFAFDSKTGEKTWSHTFTSPQFPELNVGGPRGSAAVSDGHIYFIGGGGEMFCFNAKTGDIVWENNVSQTYGIRPPRWGFSGSPLIIDDVVYIDIGRTIAFNKETGKEIWKSENFGAAYSTPAALTFKNKDYLAVFPEKGLYILDRKTGKQVAHKPWKTAYGVHAATPVVIQDKFIFMSSDYDVGCALVQFDGKGLDTVWENKSLKNQMATSIFHKGYLYGFNSSRLTCVNAETGQEMWNQRGLGRGTVIMAGETLIVLSDKGEVLTAPATPRQFRPIARARVIEGDDTIWTAPTLANGQLYIRGSRGKLVCLDVSE